MGKKVLVGVKSVIEDCNLSEIYIQPIEIAKVEILTYQEQAVTMFVMFRNAINESIFWYYLGALLAMILIFTSCGLGFAGLFAVLSILAERYFSRRLKLVSSYNFSQRFKKEVEKISLKYKNKIQQEILKIESLTEIQEGEENEKAGCIASIRPCGRKKFGRGALARENKTVANYRTVD